MRGQPVIVKQLLTKAKDSALLAVEYYNKPAVSFKSEGFIVMMTIAWSSFFHAYFLKNKIKPWYRKREKGKRPRFETVTETLPNGNIIKDKKWWDLQKCLKEFYKGNNNDPVYNNLQFLSGLRNLIVHRNLPELDASIFAECQASVINLNDYLKIYFGQKFNLDQFLSFSIQIFNSPKNFLEASKKVLQNKNAIEVVNFIKSFRSSLSTEILEDPQYSFKAVLIQVKNHQSKDALALKFINEKDLGEEQKKQLTNMGVVLVKEKEIIKDGIPTGFLSYKELIEELKKVITGIKANKEFHKVRKDISLKNPSLIHKRKLDPRNNKSTEKTFYNPKIIEEIKKHYNRNT